MRKINLLLIVSALLIVSCNPHHIPKPRGFLRIDLPENHNYIPAQINHIATFNMSAYAYLEEKENTGKSKWFNINYPEWNGKLYLSYFHLNDTSLMPLTEDARRFAYKHSVKATSIQESVFTFPIKKVHGMLYEVGGNTASAIQFFATDSLEHFMLGSLYINAEPNRDSLNPIINYISQDILHMIETLEWIK